MYARRRVSCGQLWEGSPAVRWLYQFTAATPHHPSTWGDNWLEASPLSSSFLMCCFWLEEIYEEDDQDHCELQNNIDSVFNDMRITILGTVSLHSILIVSIILLVFYIFYFVLHFVCLHFFFSQYPEWYIWWDYQLRPSAAADSSSPLSA